MRVPAPDDFARSRCYEQLGANEQDRREAFLSARDVPTPIRNSKGNPAQLISANYVPDGALENQTRRNGSSPRKGVVLIDSALSVTSK